MTSDFPGRLTAMRVLVIEDVPDIRDVFVILLRAEGADAVFTKPVEWTHVTPTLVRRDIMPRMRLDPSALVLLGIAIILAVVAYIKDPGLPWLGAKTGFTMLGFILPRLIPALILAGLMQVLVPQEIVARHFGREGGLRGIVIAAFAGILTPGGPMVSVPFMVALANSGAAMPPLVAYMTSWSLFGMQRIIAWEAPLMGWRFVFVRVIPSLAFPVLAGWLVAVFYRD